jgi:Protein of unknown function (DUF2934)
MRWSLSVKSSRLASGVSDQTTLGRISAWIDDLRQKLRSHREDRRIEVDVRGRARELWELEGRPAGRNLEFWLKAESKTNDAP